MWPAKLPGEGAALYDACEAMCRTMAELGIAVDGGKDSLSMAARVGQETVKAPGKDRCTMRPFSPSSQYQVLGKAIYLVHQTCKEQFHYPMESITRITEHFNT